jgi:flagellar biogenesis protein FliO
VIRQAARKPKTLAVCETAALGDRRFVSVIRFERRRFLIGSSPSSVTLLSQLGDESERWQDGGSAAHSGSGDKINDGNSGRIADPRQQERKKESSGN